MCARSARWALAERGLADLAGIRLQPHRPQTWKLSRVLQFIAKVRDVVGLYLDPPERAVVLCVDLKSQIQALDRTTPVLPMLPRTPQRASHDHKRFDTSSLYAALDVARGKVIARLNRPHYNRINDSGH